MIGTETLMARALRYALDKNKVAPETYKIWPTNLQLQLQELVIETADDMRYHQLKYLGHLNINYDSLKLVIVNAVVF